MNKKVRLKILKKTLREKSFNKRKKIRLLKTTLKGNLKHNKRKSK